MDPMSALSLACSVVQFVDFASKLVASGWDIAKSAQGATRENTAVEASVTQLTNFAESLKLVDSDRGRPAVRPSGSVSAELATKHKELCAPHVASIQTVASECRVLCSDILRIVNGMKVAPEVSFRSARIAMASIKSAYKKTDIRDLEDRLKTQQTRLGLCFFPLLIQQYRHSIEIAGYLAEEGRQLADGQAAGFDHVEKQLKDLKESINETFFDTVYTTAQASRRQRSKPRSPTASAPGDQTIETIKHIVDGLSSAEVDLALLQKQQSFVRSLHFEGQDARHESITDSHRTTFEWIFPDNDGLDESSEISRKKLLFSRWLETGTGTFWISGKPGSGKSTLMKFVADHPKTRSALEKWAAGTDLVIASHYFWISGTALQKSLKGLLLQLLFDILRRHPALSQDIFGARFQSWNTGYSAEVMAARGEDTWTTKELVEALDCLAKHPDLAIRACFFIDGLDEYDGDHFELCRMLKRFEMSRTIKCCVSSRPWNVFEKAFGANEDTTLRVHDLTYNDIKTFAEDSLRETSSLGPVHISPSEIEELGQYITKTADGVFLWVFLAAKTLREGLVDGDTVADLWRRLRSFPPELEPFFKRALENVNHIHIRYMAECFQMILYATSVMTVEFLLAHALEEASPDYALHPSEHDIRNVLGVPREQVERLLNARFGGLLSMVGPDPLISEIPAPAPIIFIHRTVRDFLVTKPMHDYLQTNASPTFRCHLAALKAMFFFFRGFLLGLEENQCLDTDTVATYMWPYMEINLAVEAAMGQASVETIELLDACNELVSESAFRDNAAAQNFLAHFLDKNGLPVADSDSTKSGSTKADVLRKLSLRRCFGAPSKYRAAKLATDKDYFSGYGSSKLAYDLSRSLSGIFPRSFDNTIVKELEQGADPNEKLFTYERQPYPTPWHILLQSPNPRQWLLVGFLRHGASRTCEVTNGILPLRHILFLETFCGAQRYSEAEFIEVIDVFLETSTEENQIQLADAMHYADPAQYDAEELHRMLSDTEGFEYVLSKAMGIGLPLASFDPVIKNDRLRASISPETLVEFDSHIASLRSYASSIWLFRWYGQSRISLS